MTGQSTSSKKTGSNPVFAIAVALTLATLLSGISFVIFLNSDTRKNIELIQDQSEVLGSGNSADAPDESSPLTVKDLDAISQRVLNGASTVSPDEFGSTELTDAALGL